MKRIHLFLICLAFLFGGVPLRAQWSGSMDLSGGIGGMEGNIVNDYAPMFHGLANGEFKLNYEKEKFSWKTTVKGKWEPKTTDNARLQYKNEQMSIVYKAASTKPLTSSLKSDFFWTLSQDRNYSAWVLYQYANDRAQNHTLNYDGDVQEMEKFAYYYEVPFMDEHKVESGFKSHRGFNSGRNVLKSSVSAQVIHSNKVNTWTVFKANNEGEGNESVQNDYWKYRITPTSTDINLDGDIHLQNTLLDGVTQLKITPGLRLSTKQALDYNSGATLVGPPGSQGEEIWVDSASLRETFNFLSLRTEPFLAADFRWKSLEAHADYSSQVYGRRLNDDTHQQPLKIKGVYPVGKANVKWNISPMHSLNLTNKITVAHPDYIKVCWYDRTAGYLDQLYRGNEQLLSPQTWRYGLEYELKVKRFVSNTSVSFTFVENEIDQTWTNEEIGGREYKVFHWLNTADSRSFGFTQKLGWKGEVIKSNLEVTYNQSRRTAKSNGAIKNSFDWRLKADISAKLGNGWSIGADARYQSKVATFFTLFDQYCVLNAFVKKEFKQFTFYLEGRDLLDKEMVTSFESEEQKEYWVEEVRGNRRVVVLGAKWKF